MNKILVHICCSVDSVYSLKKIKELFPDSEVYGFFYNPNIHPYSEYLLRKIDTQFVCKINDIPFYEDEYDYENWYQKTSIFEDLPEKSQRCKICHYNVLEKTAQKALELNAIFFTTTLYMSPLKSKEYLTNIGDKVSLKYGVNFLEVDLKKGGATEKTTTMVNDYSIYRQDYCGCFFASIKHREDNLVFDFSTPLKQKIYPASKEYFYKLYKLRYELFCRGYKSNIKKVTFINWRLINSILKINDRIIKDYEIEPYSCSTNGKITARVALKKDKEIKLSKDVIKILDKNTVYIREPFCSDIIIKIDENILNIGDKISLKFESSFLYNATNYELIIGEDKNYKEINLYYNPNFDIDDCLTLLETKKSIRIVSKF